MQRLLFKNKEKRTRVGDQVMLQNIFPKGGYYILDFL